MDITRHIRLQGEYDLSDKEALAALFGSLSADGPALIDMSDVTYFDSTGLHALANLRSRLGEYPVTLLGVNKNLQRLLRIVKFDHFFEIVETKRDTTLAV
jgi:anti-anti-sigma factor